MKSTLAVLAAGLGLVRLAAQDLSLVFPALTLLPAPPGIEEGIRLSYYSSVGDIRDVEYETWGGNLGTWEYTTAPSGHGYTQLDVVSLSQGVAAATVQAWQYSDWTGPLVPIRGGQSAFVGYPGGGDWWVHPQVLAEIQQPDDPELTVLRVTQILDGKSYPAIRIQRVTEKSRQATVYDLSTGLLLFRNTAVKTDKSTFASQLVYRGSRKMPSAAHPPPIPPWLQPGVEVRYRGEYIAQVMGNPPTALPLEALAQVKAVGDGWFLYEQTTTLESNQGLPPTVEKATLIGGGGNLYVDPRILKGFQAGTVLDTDPITASQLSVAATGAQVTLRSTAGSVSATEFRFDAASGLMVAFQSWDSPDPIYQLASHLELAQWPDLELLLRPDLSLVRHGDRITLSCQNGGGRQYPVEISIDGGPWLPVGTVRDQQQWETAIDPAHRCALFRLRL
jgi:hypothetical protein